MTYYFNYGDCNVYSTSDLKGVRKALLELKNIKPITDLHGDNYCILINKELHSYEVVKKNKKGSDYKVIIEDLLSSGYVVIKDFNEVQTIKL